MGIGKAGRQGHQGVRQRLAALALMFCVALGVGLPSSAAAGFEPFTKLCTLGSAAGKCSLPRGVATNPDNGHVYLGDQGNRRIDEFTAWGEFVRAWGWGVDDGSSEFQICTQESGCQAGVPGSGPGQFGGTIGVAVDPNGNVYAVDRPNLRVQKFDSEGKFLLMFGGEVEQGPKHPGNVCTAGFLEEGDICGAGTSGTGNGQFSSNWGIGNTLAMGPAGEVFVGDENRIQVFDSNGVYQRQLPLPQVGSVGEIAVDSNTGDLYMGYPNGRVEFEKTLPNVYRIDETTGAVLDTLEVDKPSALATDPAGNVYVFDQNLIVNGSSSDPASHGTRVLVFDSSGTLFEVFAEYSGAAQIQYSTGLATSSHCFGGGGLGVYLSSFDLIDHGTYDYVQALGPVPDPSICPPPDVPPEITGQFAASVGTHSATLKVRVNPHYYTPPVGITTFYVQWATAQCIDESGWAAGCVQSEPIPPGDVLESAPGNGVVTSNAIVLGGLAPDTSYRYRFVVEREREESAVPPAWVTVGVGGKPGVEGADSDFRTLPEPIAIPGCPNNDFRSGAGAGLRDCRAYELVSPLDKAGGDIQARLNIVPFEARVDQAAVSGDAITFSSYRAFGDPQSAPFSSQYLSRRSPNGWLTEPISPPQEGEAFIHPLLPIDNLYRAFSPDLESAWLQTFTEPVLGTGGVAGRPNIYRRKSSTATYEACTTAVPPTTPPPLAEVHGPQPQGFSTDGNLAVFRTENRLTGDASAKEAGGGILINQLYACSYEGGTATVRLVSVLPDGSASELENTTGGPANEQFQLSQGRTESLENAVSADGSKVFWTASSSIGPGALYLRLNPGAERTASGECEEAEPDKACTILVNAGPARFWTAADDGSIAIFSDSSGALKEYEVSTAETRPIAGEVMGVLGASTDVGRIYFLSGEEIDGEGEAGKPNLYLYDRAAESTAFIATLSSLDASQDNRHPSPGNSRPAFHSARVTPDGTAVAFMSSDPALAETVAAYDNTDQESGLPVAEIYRFALGDGLVCVSCNRSGQSPQGREVQNKTLQANTPFFAASMLPTWLNALYAPRVLSDDGNRIFFEAFEPLSLSDTNGKADVYQWEALGTGTCSEGYSVFDPQSEGCVSLLSSGKSETDSQFIDASPSGADVFIRTASSLVEWDPGQIDIYDARVSGGVPAPPTPDPECQGEGCQQPSAAPSTFLSPATTAVVTGNIHETSQPKHCRKGTHKVKRKGKVRCVKNKKHSRHSKKGGKG